MGTPIGTKAPDTGRFVVTTPGAVMLVGEVRWSPVLCCGLPWVLENAIDGVEQRRSDPGGGAEPAAGGEQLASVPFRVVCVDATRLLF